MNDKHLRRAITLTAALAAVLGVAGCTTVRSTQYSANANDPAVEGFTYYLPTRLMKVTATRTPADLGDLQKALGAKNSDLADAKTAATTASDAADKAQLLLDNLGKDPKATPEEIADAEKALRAANAVKSGTKAAVDTLSGEAKAIQTTIATVKANGSVCLYDAKIELLPAQPDRDHRYVARLVHNPFRDDTTTLKVGVNGLLSSGDVVAADRTGDIIVEAAGAIAGLGAKGGGIKADMLPPSAAQPDCAQLAKTLVRIFNPADLASRREASRALFKAHFPFAVQALELGDQTKVSDTRRDPTYGGLAEGRIFYRSPVPMIVSLEQGEAGPCDDAAPVVAPLTACVWQSVDTAVVLVPQAGPISYIPMNSSAFVKTVNNVTFSDGSIASWTAERPSEVLEVVRLPVKVASALISVPAQLLSLKVNYSSQDKSLADAQKAQIQSADALRRLKLCLEAAADEAGAQACVK